MEGGSIKDELKCKILGFIYGNDGTQTANFNNALRKGWNNLHKLKKMNDYTTPKTRGIIAHAHIISHLNYAAFSYTSLYDYQFTKMHRLIMATARWARGNYGYKVRTSHILNEFNMLNEHRLVALASFKFICNVAKTGSPQPIFAEIRFPRRQESKISPRQWPKISFVQKHFYFYSMLNVYNNMPFNLKLLEMQKLKPKAKREICAHPNPQVLRRAK